MGSFLKFYSKCYWQVQTYIKKKKTSFLTVGVVALFICQATNSGALKWVIFFLKKKKFG